MAMSAVGFEPTRSKTLRPERNPLDHSGKLTGSPLSSPHITKKKRFYNLLDTNDVQIRIRTHRPTRTPTLATHNRTVRTNTCLRLTSPSKLNIVLAPSIASATRFNLLMPITYYGYLPIKSMSSMDVLQRTYRRSTLNPD